MCTYYVLDVLWCQLIKLIQVFFCPIHLVQGLRRLDDCLLQKLGIKTFDQKFKYVLVPYLK